MTLLAILAGVLVGYLITGSVIGAAVGGAIGAAIVMLAGIGLGSVSASRARAATLVDLLAPEPVELDVATYVALPLAIRNAAIARTVAAATDRPVEYVIYALPDLMGLQARSNVPTQKAVQDLLSATQPALLDRRRADVILSGELRLSVSALRAATEHARATIERNTGTPLTDELLKNGLLTAVFPALDRVSVADLVAGALVGSVNLAYAVGLMRKATAKESAKFRQMPG